MERPSYYAIIPANVRYDKDLTPNAKLLYGEITALCNEKGFCWSSDKYFMDLYAASKASIQRWMKSLEDKGFINREVQYKDNSNEIQNRYIKLATSPILKNENTYNQKRDEGILKNETTPILKNEVDNNTYINNTINNTIEYNMSIESTFQKIEFDKSIKGDAELYKYGMDLYHDFVLKHSGVKPNITGTTGKALKYLITYFKGLSENKDYSEVKSHFENVFSNYETWDTFYKKNLKLEFISSNIVNIIKSIKDGKSTQQSNYKTKTSESQFRTFF
ncbi:helix-turn-helix domain-containing protein [Sphingobacterium siyangense]|uniref:helix-turn-helix domain-containing protein n=1 Tax=Sphingobacterium siyangense TaxID=459529 RepID=UPI003DA30FDB